VAKKSIVALMSNGGRRLCSRPAGRALGQLAALQRHGDLGCRLDLPSSASTCVQNPGMAKTCRATSQARVMSGTDAPVSSFSGTRT
jgi:hypothetical protein